ncbi:ECF transporter S component [Clostridium sp. P21]|uniref:ECF transporter S component n=1 Tax=Clostridium muellerianum TaxID=2716538 RepID=A0A7Y0EDW2_9CLOT|nr:ECF transporter S component [Clostridium muellerianum]NMM61581.1 ECF transporter S component [Clostridium muellerianum]
MIENVLLRGKFKTRQVTIIGMLSAVTIILGATGLGFIPIPPFKTTIMHIPVIIGGIVEGPVVGAFIGLMFGIFSIIQAINTPTPVSFIFINPLIAILPRMLIGVTSYYVYKLLCKKSKSFGIICGTVVGSFTNTLGVLGLIYVIYINAYANALHISYKTAVNSLLALVLNGFISAGMAVAVSFPIVMALKKVRK